jgi:hypothetical protein
MVSREEYLVSRINKFRKNSEIPGEIQNSGDTCLTADRHQLILFDSPPACLLRKQRSVGKFAQQTYVRWRSISLELIYEILR